MNEIRPENDVTRLSVPQVILLSLLTTMISSVATAIVVVQLMSGVPGETVFQTIERVTETVVERSVEVPAEPALQTIVIKEGDLVARAVANNNNSSLPIYYGSESEVILLSHAVVVGDDVLVTQPMENPDQLTTAGLHTIATHGADKIMLWRIVADDPVFTGVNAVNFSQGNPQIGQTLIYLSGGGSIVRGLVSGVSATELDFSENLSGREVGLILDVGGGVLGLWTGNEILRSEAVITQIDQLSANPLYEIPDDGFDLDTPIETNPDDVTTEEKQESCELLGGTLNEYDECLGVDQSACAVLGGAWEECGSACRHDPDAQVCTLQCALYCQL